MDIETVVDNTKKKFMEKILQNNDPMIGMERLEMIVTSITHPFPHVARITGKIKPLKPELWTKPNIALRLEVGFEDEGKRPLTRVYTVRQFDKKTNLLEIDFIIHNGDAPAMHWLDKAQEGTLVFLIGPRQHFIPNYNLGHKIVFFADDTAIPALYAILSQWPQGLQAIIYIDCSDPHYPQELPNIDGISYHIHVRDNHEKAGKSNFLPTSAKKLRKGKDWQIWVACEREEAREIRQYFIESCGIEKDNMKAIGYWKYGLSSSQIDDARLSYYAELHASGKSLQQFEEFDVPV